MTLNPKRYSALRLTLHPRPSTLSWSYHGVGALLYFGVLGFLAWSGLEDTQPLRHKISRYLTTQDCLGECSGINLIPFDGTDYVGFFRVCIAE